jgi:hypothetical protein
MSMIVYVPTVYLDFDRRSFALSVMTWRTGEREAAAERAATYFRILPATAPGGNFKRGTQCETCLALQA